jgi:hypothetical protein
MKINFILILVFIGLCSFVSAQTNDVEDISEYGWELLRDPFTPVGYIPPKKKVMPSLSSNLSNDQINWPKLDIKAITKDNDGSYIVFIKGQGMVEEGDVITVRKAGYSFEFEVTEVTKSGVKYKKRRFTPLN